MAVGLFIQLVGRFALGLIGPGDELAGRDGDELGGRQRVTGPRLPAMSGHQGVHRFGKIFQRLGLASIGVDQPSVADHDVYAGCKGEDIDDYYDLADRCQGANPR